MKTQSRRPVSPQLFAYLFVLLTLSLGWFVCKVRRIECRLNDAPCPDAISSQLQQVRGTPMIGVDLGHAAENMLTTEPVKVVTLSKRLPGTVRIHLQQIPYSYLIINGDQTHAVSTEGKLYTPLTQPDILAIKSAIPLSELQDVDGHIRSSLHNGLVTLAEHKREISDAQEIELLDNMTLQITMKSGVRVLLLIEKVTESISELTQIVTAPEYQKLQKEYTEIDLRFKLPVLRKKQ